MKKKGLIVATIVMVLVLAVSLTTATYAWFTQDDSTSIEAFTISVAPGSAVVVGLKANNTYDATADNSAFVSGDCNYAPKTSGVTPNAIGGVWTGTQGLGYTLNPHLNIKTVSTAVGVTTASAATGATQDNTGFFNKTGGVNVIKANLGEEAGTLTNKDLAVANGKFVAEDDITNIVGDYAYLYLGAQATKALTTLNLKVGIVSSDKTTLGNAAAMHVAYKIGNDTTWTDKDVFGDNHYGKLLTQVTADIDFGGTTGLVHDQPGAAVVSIPLSVDQEVINHIQIVVYLAGSDSDCINAATGATSTVYLFFESVDATD